jgi:hypothetical protein
MAPSLSCKSVRRCLDLQLSNRDGHGHEKGDGGEDKFPTHDGLPGPRNNPAISSAASACIAGMAWEYTSIVKLTLE